MHSLQAFSHTLIYALISSYNCCYMHAVVVEFQPNLYRVNEAAGAVTFTIVKRSQTTERVVVRFLTQDGSATCKLNSTACGKVEAGVIPINNAHKTENGEVESSRREECMGPP